MDSLIADTYAGDGYGSAAILKLVNAGPPWRGMYLKASEGTYYPNNRPDDKEWFLDNWFRVRVYAGDRYGKDWFRGAYHYFRVGEDPIVQADNFISTVETAGGWNIGDLFPMVDVESAENPANASKAQIEDGVSAFVERGKAVLGRRFTLYGNIYLAEHGVTSHMGCDTLCVARYSSTLPPTIYERIGWKLQTPAQFPSLLSWQLDGDGEEYVPGYPKNTPMGPCDYAALVIGGGGAAAVEWLAANINTPPGC